MIETMYLFNKSRNLYTLFYHKCKKKLVDYDSFTIFSHKEGGTFIGKGGTYFCLFLLSCEGVCLLGMGTQFFHGNLAMGTLIREGTFIRDHIVHLSSKMQALELFFFSKLSD